MFVSSTFVFYFKNEVAFIVLILEGMGEQTHVKTATASRSVVVELSTPKTSP